MEDWVISHVCITPILGTIKTELKRLHLKSGNIIYKNYGLKSNTKLEVYNYYGITRDFHKDQETMNFLSESTFRFLHCNILRSLSANTDITANMLNELHHPFSLKQN